MTTQLHSPPTAGPEEVLRPRSGQPLPSSLEGAWIEIFRAGDYADRGLWTPEHLDHLAATYNPRLHAAPVVLGHPADDAPAYAWVRCLRRAGASLWAQLEKVDPTFEALLRAGRFAQRSVALYTHFPQTGGPYLRHLGFLGAAPPAVKGLDPVRFTAAPSISFAFDTPSASEIAMPEPKSKLEAFVDHLRAFFTPEPSSESQLTPVAPAPGPAFAERLAALEQRLETLTARPRAVTPSEAEGRVEGFDPSQIANFAESLRSRGRFPPLYDRLGVKEFMERLAAAESNVWVGPGLAPGRAEAAGDGSALLTASKPLPYPTTDEDEACPAKSQPSLLVWFQEFLTRLPAVIEFRELASGSGPARRSFSAGGSRLVRFTEPRRGMSVDPASVELAERAEALAADLGISYAQALTQLREERRTLPPTA